VEAAGRSGRSFAFTRCFDEGATQEEVFEACGVRGQVERSLDGFASLIFAFGQTGAGKTYTMVRARERESERERWRERNREETRGHVTNVK
jgi:Kinesin motor domain